MKNLAIFTGGLLVVFLLVFGYFLQRSNWDVRLAGSMMIYDVNQIISGGTPSYASINTDSSSTAANNSSAQDNSYTHTDASADDESQVDIAQDAATSAGTEVKTAPKQPAHGKDSIYRGDGNSFSDMQRTGNESAYESPRKEF